MTERPTGPLPERGVSCPPAGLIEAFVAGDDPGSGVGGHVVGCAACSSYVRKLESEQAAFFKQRPAELFLNQLEGRSATPRSGLSTQILRWAGVAGLAASVAIAILVFTRPASIQLKGGAFEVVYKRPGMSEPGPVTEDLRLRPGDALRFSYQAANDGYLLVLEVDANGKVTSLYPLRGVASAAIHSRPGDFLPGSVVLDDAPGPEWLVAVFSRAPIRVDSLSKTLAPPSALVAPTPKCGDCKVESLRIQKEL